MGFELVAANILSVEFIVTKSLRNNITMYMLASGAQTRVIYQGTIICPKMYKWLCRDVTL